eukprot:ANDGO_00816.mRNA.1 DNA replication licensing factor MCM7
MSNNAPAQPQQPSLNLNINYDSELQKVLRFLQTYQSPVTGEYKYLRMIQDVANRDLKLVEINLDDVFNQAPDKDLGYNILRNSVRYRALIEDAIEKLLPQPTKPLVDTDIFDVLMTQRIAAADRAIRADQFLMNTLSQQAASESQTASANNDDDRDADVDMDALTAHSVEDLVRRRAIQSIPPALRRRFEVSFKSASKEKPVAIRSVRAQHIGHLVSIAGIVTRVSDVRPEMKVATYVCESCSTEVYQEVTARSFKPLIQCPLPNCANHRRLAGSTNPAAAYGQQEGMDGGNSGGRLVLQTRGSRMDRFQEIRIQERPQDVPVGHIPRTMVIHAHGELTRQCLPGDMIHVSGVFLPVPRTGFRAMKAGLLADTFVEAMSIEPQKRSYDQYELTEDDIRIIESLAQRHGVYSILSRSIAPEIHGHEDVKRALLLLLCGAPPRSTPDGMRIRGDLHMCLMGDPGVAKSQLLRFVSQTAPRGVYTTGKGSSGVGLTAAVVRDPITGDVALEGGALVLADMGICCIDEFDKMDDHDRSAIHEVMEQQSVSIAKAGMQATLNARASVLAAANPLYGRYDRRRTPAQNIALPAALLSRFDVLFVLTDDANPERDSRLARHVTYVHQNLTVPPDDDLEEVTNESGTSLQYLSPQQLRAYIAHARKYSPVVPKELVDYFVSSYVDMRRVEHASGEDAHSYTTARTLLSVLRLSQAMARLRFAEEVEQSDVEEAIRLMQASKSALVNDDEHGRRTGGRNNAQADPISAIYAIIREHLKKDPAGSHLVEEILPQVIARGFTRPLLEETIKTYQELNVIHVSADSLSIKLIS